MRLEVWGGFHVAGTSSIAGSVAGNGVCLCVCVVYFKNIPEMVRSQYDTISVIVVL